jgi:hypothetical protein
MKFDRPSNMTVAKLHLLLHTCRRYSKAHDMVGFSYPLLCSWVKSRGPRGATIRSTSGRKRNKWTNVKLLLGTIALTACSQPQSLSITLVNPNTKESRKCAARETSANDAQVLASTVELCAKQLEARGFVRANP